MTVLSTDTIYTYKEYLEMNRTVLNREFHKRRTQGFTMAILLIASATLALCTEYDYAFIVLLFTTAMFFANRQNTKRQVKKAFFSNKMAQNVSFHFDFHEDYVEGTSPQGKSLVKYEQLYKIHETKSHFYLMSSRIAGSIIRKQNCSPELITFLQSVKKHYKL